MQCRICKKEKLVKFLDLGFTPPADGFLTAKELEEPEAYYPLSVYICQECSLVQLGYVVPPEILFQKDYPYESSMTQTGRQHFYAFAKKVVADFSLAPQGLVVDIGSNVGVLLQGFKNEGMRVLGIEPAKNISRIAQQNGIPTLNKFFNVQAVAAVRKSQGLAKVVTASNVFAHVNDLHAFVKNLDNLLNKKGIFIVEAPYLATLLDNLEYDTIYHEHLSYLSVKPLNYLFHQFKMEIFDIQEVGIHGGSLRYFISRKGDYQISSVLRRLMSLEDKKKIYSLSRLRAFARDVERNRADLAWMLYSLKKKGKRIVGVSAPAKGMTLMNYCRIGPEVLDFVTEKSTLKIGKFTPGMHIPVYPDARLIKEKPDFALLLAWNFAPEIMRNLKDYQAQGGRFIVPIPRPHIVK